MKFAVLEFPGSNCDHDCEWVLEKVFKQKVSRVWHQDTQLPKGIDCVMVPGGFSYGDYLRCGAIARFANIMPAVQAHAKRGGLVWGICNGFQILTESGLLPGALLRNASLKFICHDTYLRVERVDSAFTNEARQGQVLRVPVAHGEGAYFCDDRALAELRQRRQIVFRYCDQDGEATREANPNGSLDNIAGILNAKGNVLGMMPHPERVAELAMGGVDGKVLFESALNALSGARR